jgi:hypothetical protein
MTVEQVPLVVHGSLHAKVPFLAAIELEVENLPPHGVDS